MRVKMDRACGAIFIYLTTSSLVPHNLDSCVLHCFN